LIILDEADEMTSEAQTALRRIIEDSSKTTRFIIICNYLSRIIDPLQSRCVVFRFKRITAEEVEEYLKLLCKKEGVKYEEKAITSILESTQGDMRHSINVLQGAAVMGLVSTNTVQTSLGISGKAKIAEVIKLAIAGKFNEARIKLLELTMVYAMSEFDFLKYASQIGYSMKLSHPEEFAALMAEYDHRLITGAHPEIQLAALLAQLGKLDSKSN